MFLNFQLIFLPLEPDRDFHLYFNSVLLLTSYIRILSENTVLVHSLHGAAKFVVKYGNTVLYLDGTQETYAETSAIPFQQTDLTIPVWIKLVSPLSKRQEIYADWSSPWQFRFGMQPDGRLHFQRSREG